MLCMEEILGSATGGIGKRLCNKPSGHDGDHDFVFGPNCPCGHPWHTEDCATCGCPPIRDVPGEPRGAGFRRLEALNERRRDFVRGTISQVAQEMAARENGVVTRTELAALLRKVTANLRDAIEDAAKAWGRPEPVLQAALEKNGVLEAEALLKRIDEGTS